MFLIISMIGGMAAIFFLAVRIGNNKVKCDYHKGKVKIKELYIILESDGKRKVACKSCSEEMERVGCKVIPPLPGL